MNEQELLTTIEQVLAGQAQTTDPKSLEGFCAWVRVSAPSPDEALQQRLEHRLASALETSQAFYPASHQRISPLQSQPEREEAMTVISPALPVVTEKSAFRRSSRSFMTLVTAVFALIMLCIVLFYSGQENPVVVGNNPLSLRDLPSITKENVGQLAEVKRLGNGVLSQVIWSPDGRTLAASGPLGVWLYDAEHLEMPPRLLKAGSQNEVATLLPRHAAFSPDSRLIAAADGYDIRIWNIQTGEVIVVLSGHGNNVNTITFSSDGKWLASGGGEWETNHSDNSVRLWDLSTGKGQTLFEATASILSLTFSHDSKILAVDDYSKTVTLWDIQENKITRQIEREPNNSDSVITFSPDDTRLVLNDQHGVGLWDVTTSEKVSEIGMGQHYVTEAVFTPDGSYLVMSSRNAGIQIWDSQTDTFVEHPHLSDLRNIMTISLHPDGNMLAAIGLNGAIQIWDLKEDQLKTTLRDHSGGIRYLVLDGMRTIYGGQDRIYIRDLESGELNQDYPIVVDLPTALAFDPKSQTLAFSGFINLSVPGQFGIHRININTGEALNAIGEATQYYLSLDFSPDGKYLASASTFAPSIQLWNLLQQPVSDFGRRWFSGIEQPFYTVHFSPAGDKLAAASASDGKIYLWDRKTGEVLVSPAIQSSTYYQPLLAFSTDSRMLAVSEEVDESSQQTTRIHLVDPTDGQEIRSFEHPVTSLTDMAFSPDGKLLAYVAASSFYVQDIDTGTILYQSSGELLLNRISFDTKSRFIVTGGWDGLVRVWGVP